MTLDIPKNKVGKALSASKEEMMDGDGGSLETAIRKLATCSTYYPPKYVCLYLGLGLN